VIGVALAVVTVLALVALAVWAATRPDDDPSSAGPVAQVRAADAGARHRSCDSVVGFR